MEGGNYKVNKYSRVLNVGIALEKVGTYCRKKRRKEIMKRKDKMKEEKKTEYLPEKISGKKECS